MRGKQVDSKSTPKAFDSSYSCCKLNVDFKKWVAIRNSLLMIYIYIMACWTSGKVATLSMWRSWVRIPYTLYYALVVKVGTHSKTISLVKCCLGKMMLRWFDSINLCLVIIITVWRIGHLVWLITRSLLV